jgi:hypothetical protein
MQKSSLQVFGQDSWVDPLTQKELTSYKKIARMGDSLRLIAQGQRKPVVVHRDTLAGHVTCVAGSSGDTVLTIGGVDITVTYATSQTNTAGLLVAAVNASTTALAKGGLDVEADNRKATVTLTSTAVGMTCNIGQYQLKAVAKAAANYGEFEVSGSDTADAAAMVAAIKAWPGLSDLVACSNSSGVVSIFSRRASTPDRDLALSVSSEVASAAVLTASTTVCVSSVRKGVIGNHITTAISGTGTSISGARISGGTTTVETL